MLHNNARAHSVKTHNRLNIYKLCINITLGSFTRPTPLTHIPDAEIVCCVNYANVHGIIRTSYATHHVDEFLERYESGSAGFLGLLRTFVQ